MSREPAGDPVIERLLAAERDDPAPAASLARVWSRVSASVAPAAGLFAPLPPPRRTLSGAIRARPLAAVSAALLVGSMIGGSAVAWVTHGSLAAHAVAVTASAATASAATASASPLPMAAASQASEVLASAPVPAAPPPVAAVSAAPVSPAAHRNSVSGLSSLSEERALLDAARAALGAGDGERALAMTETHQRRFAHPQLAEEREAIAIQALVIAGRFGEARARAARFQEIAPDSLFAPAVLASLASIPR
jgi:hypothetical protein